MSAPTPRRLFHYCCSHSVDGILASGQLRPHPGGHQQKVWLQTGLNVLVMPVVWLTDLEVGSEADADLIGLGLNTGLVTCDRLEYRFRVPRVASVEWWPTWADRAVAEGRIKARYRENLELDRAPERWWVSEAPIRGPRLDERYRRPSVTPCG